MATKLVLIHDDIKDKQVIIDSLLQTGDVKYIEIGKYDTSGSFYNKLNAISSTLGNVTRIGLVFDNITGGKVPFFIYSDDELNHSTSGILSKLNKYEIDKNTYNTKIISIKNAKKTIIDDIQTCLNAIKDEVITKQSDNIDNKNGETVYNIRKDILPDIDEETGEIIDESPYTQLYSKLYPSVITKDNNPDAQYNDNKYPGMPIIPYPNFYGNGNSNMFSDIFKTIITSLKIDENNSFQSKFAGLGYLDIISCDISRNKYINDFTYMSNIGISINYSESTLGAIYGNNVHRTNNWLLTKQGGNIVNTFLVGIYFNSNINTYKYQLGATANFLNGIIANQDDMYCLMTSAVLADMTRNYIVTADIDMSTYVFPSESIGRTIAYQGILDGQGYTITIGNTLQANYIGLFWQIGTSVADDCGVTNLNIVYKKDPNTNNILAQFNSTQVYIGGLFSIIFYGAVNNCKVIYDGNVSITTSTNNAFGGLGGLTQIGSVTNSSVIYNKNITLTSIVVEIGGLLAATNGSVLDNNTVTHYGNVIYTAPANPFTSQIGGIIGRMYNSSTSVNICSRNNIICYGTFSITNSTFSAGGLVGFLNNFSTLHTCNGTFNGSVDINCKLFAGGIIGFCSQDGYAVNCNVIYNSNLNIIADTTLSDCFAGGICGLNTGTNEISDCSITVKGNTLISAKSTVNVIFVSGMVGKNEKGLYNCTANYNTLTMRTNIDNNVQFTSHIGGISGWNATNGIINNCIINVDGSLNVLSPIQANVLSYVGGLIGRQETNSSVISSSCNFTGKNGGSINIQINKLTSYVGGLFGYITENAQFAKRIDNCSGLYALPTIINNTALNTNTFGGIAGYINRNAVNKCSCVFNSTLNVNISSTQQFTGIYVGLIGAYIFNSFVSNCNVLCNDTVTFTINAFNVNISMGIHTTTIETDSIYDNNTVIINGLFTMNTVQKSQYTELSAICAALIRSKLINSKTVFNGGTNMQLSANIFMRYGGICGIISSSNSSYVLNNSVTFSDNNVFNSKDVILNYAIIGTITGLLFGGAGHVITNNIVTYGNDTEFKIREGNSTLVSNIINIGFGFSNPSNSFIINNPTYISNNSIITFNTYVTTSVTPTGIIYSFPGGTQYPSVPSSYITTDNYNILVDVVQYDPLETYQSFRILISYYVPPAITVPPCCDDKCIVQENPQVSNYDMTSENEIIAGKAIGSDVKTIYEQVNTVGRINSKPIFSSYRDYLMFLQSQNYRR